MSEFWSDLWAVIWTFFWIFAFTSYLFALFNVVADLFRDRELSGWLKAVWVLLLIFLPFITVLVYLITRGSGMAARGQRQVQQYESANVEYIRDVAGRSSVDEIGQAKALLDSGAITPAEYESIKQKTLV